ncbi:hypothetical protein COV06_03365 [Candidatus Uhrbacteria bacterium CG10_big_fil_rev_8_21_14_0_10_50_16]|uniref:Uncharacterized protein n=1 Tax=Candidatus Uhrbacteria bacterium CG10_big_fil_rev_8_21_14_0_10_50_16 TaxID=1975039 RepID=A0A2H0RLY1_9BACT|nr:MAG: hypothetical protein COV06_03365 [Candidatus Uhrbacteria bacterium CG10_big_fil_rev_8_21_14_0_10_50_16]
MGENVGNPNFERAQAQAEKIKGVYELRGMIADVTDAAVDQLRFDRVMEAMENDRYVRDTDLSELNTIREGFADYAVLLNEDRTQQQSEKVLRKYFAGMDLNGREWKDEGALKMALDKIYEVLKNSLYTLEEDLGLEHRPHPKDEYPEPPTQDVS